MSHQYPPVQPSGPPYPHPSAPPANVQPSAPPAQHSAPPPSSNQASLSVDSISRQANSLFSAIGRGVQHARLDMNRNLTNMNKKVTEKLDNLQFMTLFKIPPDEPLFIEIPCKAFTVSGPLIGFLYLTARRVCFYSEAVHPEIITVTVPWKTVSAVCKGVMKEGSSGVASTVITIEPNAHESLVKQADVIQFYTVDRQVHQFYGFSDYERISNLAKYLWHVDVRYNPVMP